MKIRYPQYYKEFSCIAGACPDSCCKEWEVDVDPEAAALYRSLPGALGDRLRQVLREGDDGWASMAITADRRCPMWRQDGLCQIQAELGHEALCATCREFPRLRHDYGDFVELGLELSCPEAARLILASPAPDYLTEVQPGGAEADYDADAMALLLHSRAQILALLQDPEVPLADALAGALLYAYGVQEALDGGQSPEPPQVPDLDSLPLTQPADMEAIFDLYRSLEVLTPEWARLLEAGPRDQPWLPEHRALAAYLVERYWLQAVSDLDLLCRAKFLVTSCLMVRSLKAGPLQAAQLYSKEIENDADNVEALLEAAYTAPALADLRLLSLLKK